MRSHQQPLPPAGLPPSEVPPQAGQPQSHFASPHDDGLREFRGWLKPSWIASLLLHMALLLGLAPAKLGTTNDSTVAELTLPTRDDFEVVESVALGPAVISQSSNESISLGKDRWWNTDSPEIQPDLPGF